MILRIRITCLTLFVLVCLSAPVRAQQDNDSSSTATPAAQDETATNKPAAEKSEQDSDTKADKDSDSGAKPTSAKDEASNTTEAAKTEESEAKESKAEQAKEKKLPQLRQINIAGNYVDLVQPLSFDATDLLLGGTELKQRSFYKLCEFLHELEDNERISYVLLDLSASGIAMNSAQLDELTRHLSRLRDAGKKTFAWLEDASNVHLAIAAGCDEVIMADFGGIDMPSVAMQSMFFADAMDLLGVKASVVRAGDFKGAVEPYLNPRMSDHLREHYRAMLKSMNDAQVDRIARGRGLKSSRVRELQQQRMLLPEDAKRADLVDKLAPFGAMESAVKAEIDEEIEWVTPTTAAKKQVSMFQLMGQMMAGPEAASRIHDNSIVVVHLDGMIVNGKKSAPGRIVAGPTVAMIQTLAEDDKVKGAVIRVNSPGGSATASEAVRQALLAFANKKPTVVSMGDMAASGGYWISCIDQPIYAEKGTLTGSIGVFSMKFSAGALMRRIGVHLETIALDDTAGLFALDRTWSDEDQQKLQGTIDMVYDRFLNLVSDSRGIKVEQLEPLAGGRVWSGSQAKVHGLVDEIGGVDDCLNVVAKKAGLDDYRVVHRPTPRTGLDLSELFGSGGEEEIWQDVSRTAVRALLRRGISLETTKLLISDGLHSSGKPTVWLLHPSELRVGWQ